MRMKKLLFLIIIHSCIVIIAQKKELQFTHLSTELGLSNSEVIDIAQDKEGFIWIATMDGLNRFDGINFKIYRRILNDSTSLSDNYIYSILIDKKGDLWLGTYKGLSHYNRGNDLFSNYQPEKNTIKDGYPNAIVSINEDKSNRLFVITQYGKLFEFDRNNKYFKLLIDINRPVESMYIDSYDKIWIASEGLFIYDVQKKELNTVHNTFAKFRFNCVLEDSDKYWISTAGSGIFWLDKRTKNITKSFITNNINDEDFINKIYKDKQNNIWIGNNAGLKLYDRKNGIFYNYIHDDKDVFSLSTLGVKSFFEDCEGNYWSLNKKGGLNVAEAKKKFENITTTPIYKIYISKPVIGSLLIDHNGRLWAGSFNGGLDLIDFSKETVHHFENDPVDNNSIGKSSALMTFEDSKKNIWVGTFRGGLQKNIKKTNSFITFLNDPNNNKSIGGNDIRSVAEDKEGNLWLAVHGKGIDKFDVKHNVFFHFTSDVHNLKNSLIDNWTFVILCDNEGNIWVGTSNGLSMLNKDKKSFTNYQNIPNEGKSLSNNFINCLYEDSKKNIWIGTQEGLNQFNKKEKTFKSYFLKDGLPNNVIKGILEDDKQNLWISTNKGLSKFDLKSQKIRIYNTYDGIASEEFAANTFYKNKAGKMFFGSNKGITMFYPDSIKDNAFIPPVYITDFKIFNKSVPIGLDGSPLTSQISQTKEIKLHYYQSVFSFEFIALNYIQPRKNQYAYIMEGFEKEWNYVGNKRDATYTNLEPGVYTFRVKASNNDGVWNENGTSLKLTILPPFWKTWWFRIIIIMSILIVAYIAIYLRLAFFRKQQQELTFLVKERTKELEESNVLLEEKQEEIYLQKEELMTQKDTLEDTNKVLVQQKQQIIEQNKELDKHHNELESLIDERTRELEMAKLKAEESDSLKSAFLANMSHEIRTPMNAIIGFSSILRDQSLSSNEKEDIIGIIINNGESLMGLINDILDLSKIHANQVILYPLFIHLPSLLKEIFDNFTLEAENSHLVLKLALNEIPADFVLDTDKLRLKQVINNLIQNALKFTPSGSIEFGVKEINDDVTFFVKDTGIGIDQNIGNSIFERFQKIESKDQIYSGTGLGLAICKSLVELWGGTIWYKSELDKGATFYFTHPVSFQIEKRQHKPQAQIHFEIPDLSGKKILIAEDETNNFRLLKVYLAKTNATIIHAKNGKEAIEYAQQFQIDAILMDLKMPIIDGFEATRQIKKLKPEIPIIAQTAYAFENEKNEFSKLGISDYLVKPIQINDLMNALIKVLNWQK
jgi:signal transduction histidine kinase/ligand-binding sensor domain-containing protein/CheY-like chemotaxis protein